MEKAFQKHYYKGFKTGILSLWRAMREDGFKISQKQAKEWLNSQSAYQMHYKEKTPKKFGKIMAYGIKEHWMCDLLFMFSAMDMKDKGDQKKIKLPKYNRGYKYILVVIDVFTKMVYIKPLKRKEEAVANAFRDIVEKYGAPNRLSSDNGGEFVGKHFQKVLKDHDITHQTCEPDDHKAQSVVERVNRTLREKIFSFMDQYDTYVWIDEVQDIVDAYNNTYHNTIKMKPSKVTKKNELDVYQRVFNPAVYDEPEQVFKIGDRVRVRRKDTTFQKGSEQRYSRRVHTVTDVRKAGSCKLEGQRGWFRPYRLKLVTDEKTNPFKRKGDTEDIRDTLKKARETEVEPIGSRVTPKPKRIRKPAYKMMQDGIIRG